MKTKLLFGLATTGVASLFWACGSGDILDFQPTDQFVQYDYASGGESDAALANMVNQAISDYCTASGAGSDCNEALQPDKAPTQQEQSSSSSSHKSINPNETFSNSSTDQSSSNQNSGVPNIVNPTSSNSNQGNNQGNNQGTSSNSNVPVVPASSSVAPTNDGSAPWGTCSIVGGASSVKKGSSVNWKIAPQQTGPITSPSEMMQLKYAWSFQGGNPNVFSGGNDAKNVLVDYAVSGTFATTVTITTTGGQSQTISCPVLEVTGAEVTGCKCSAAAATADVVTAPNFGWNVTGCMSADGATAFTYAWSEPFSAYTTSSLTLAAQAKGSYKPTVVVKNADNGLMNVTCDEVVITDANNPDVVLTSGGKTYTLDAGKTYSVTYNCATQFYQGKVSMSSQTNASVTWAYGTKSSVANITPSSRVSLDYSTLFGSPTYNSANDGALISITVNSGTVSLGCE